MHGLASEDFIRGCHQGIEVESRNARRRWALRTGFGGVQPKGDEDALRGFPAETGPEGERCFRGRDGDRAAGARGARRGGTGGEREGEGGTRCARGARARGR